MRDIIKAHAYEVCQGYIVFVTLSVVRMSVIQSVHQLSCQSFASNFIDCFKTLQVICPEKILLKEIERFMSKNAF